MPRLPLQSHVGRGRANRPEDVIAVKTRLIELGFTWLAPATSTPGPEFVRTIRLFQAIKNGIGNVNHMRNDGIVQKGEDTHRWLEAANAPRWMQMSPGSRAEGFVNVEVADASDNHDFGTNWLDETIRAAGAHYAQSFLAGHASAAPLTVNDVSIPGGGDTPDHAEHESGIMCDLRLPRKDGGAGQIEVSSPKYDRNAMRAMIISFREQKLASRVLLNDERLRDEGLCSFSAGHHDHAHFEIEPPARGNP